MAEAEKIKTEVETRMNPIELVISGISPVVGVHVGPGTLGLAYYAD